MLIKDTMWLLSNVACDSADTAMCIIQNDIFNKIVQKMATSSIEIRKEAMIVVGHTLTCMPNEHLVEVLEIDD